MFSLSQLIFIDSYSPGKRAKVCLTGNTNLNGDNGTGKTTMLRVLPLFFGAKPGDIVRQSGSNQSFANYYLPRLSSYIVFEYEREEDKNLVVVFRRDQSLRFCFLESAYSDDLFFIEPKESSHVISCNDWVKTMKLRSLDPTQAMGVEDYRLIIQSGLNFTSSADRKHKSFINESRLRFSYCRRGSSIENIELITSAILDREPCIEAIKEILTSILEQSSSVKSEIPKLSIKPAKLTAWINDRDAYQAMCKCEDGIKALSTSKFEYHESLSTQHAYRSHAEAMLEKIKTRWDFHLSEKEKVKRRWEAHKNDFDSQQRKYSNNKREVKSELDSLNKKINVLENERDDYKQKKVIEKEKLVNEIPAIKLLIADLDKQYQDITDGQQDIDNTFERFKSKCEVRHQTTVIALQKELQTLTAEFQKKQLLFEREKANELADERKNNENRRETLLEERTSLKVEIATLEEQHKNTPPPSELTTSYNKIDEGIAFLITQTEKIDSNFQKLKQQQESHLKKVQDKTTLAEQRIAEKQKLEAQLDQLRQLKNPSKDNLLSFLRSNHDSWAENIAKVVPESLLLRSDLSPEVADSNQNLYGISLDLSVVETSLAADEVLLQQKMIRIDDELEQIESIISGLSLTSEKLNKETKSFDTHVFQSQSKLTRHKQDIKNSQGDLELAKLKIDQSIEKKKVELQSDIDKTTQKIVNVDTRLEQSNHSYDASLKSIQSEYKRKNDELGVQRKDKQKNLESREQNSKDKRDEELGELEKQKIQALIKKGVDPEFLEKITSDLSAKNNEIEQANKAIDLVENYHRWFVNDWSEYDSLKTQSRRTNETLNDLIENWKTQKKNLEEREGDLEKEYNDINKQCNQSEANANLLQRMLENYPDKSNETSECLANILLPETPELLDAKWVSEIKSEQAIRKKAEDNYAQIRRKINAFRNSTPQQFLDRMTTDISSQYSHYNDEWIYASDNLADYMRQGHQDHLQTLHSTAELIGAQISDYHTGLDRTHKEINSLGKRVTKHTQDVIGSFPSINNLSVIVTSSLDKLNFWDALKQFSESHQAWRARSTALKALPDSTYIERLQLVSTLIEKSGVNIQLAKSFSMTFSITDQGQTKVARTNKELEDISSHGLAYLILISIYTALVNMLRGNSNVRMIWPVDELGTFSEKNTVNLMILLERHKIHLFSAFPDPKPELLKYYKNRYLIEEGRTLVEYPDDVPDTTDDINNLLSEMVN